MATGAYMVKPDTQARLKEFDPDDTGTFKSRDGAQAAMQADIVRLRNLQEELYVDARFALLLVLQGMDTSGKDGVVRHLSGALQLTGAQVTSFREPNRDELEHDFLWRVHQRVPARRMIGIFNRSHYEDVLVVRVHKLVPESVWQPRYHQINDFERLLVESNVVVVKCFLHISKDEQKKRLQSRLDDRAKLWKFLPSDLSERAYWDDYQKAYAAVLSDCSTAYAPWHVVPANHKWYRNYAVTRLLVETLEGLHLKLPKPVVDPDQVTIP